MNPWPGIGLALAAFTIAMISPGPAFMATVGTAMGQGRRAGTLFGLGVVCGSTSWGLMAAFGLTALLAAYGGAMTGVKIAGGFYLLYLAYKAVLSARSAAPLAGKTIAAPSALGYFLRGWGLHITNPKMMLSWVATITLGLRPGAPGWVPFVILAATTLLALGFYMLLVAAFSSARMIALYGRARRRIDTVLAVFFALAGVTLFLV